MDTTRSRPEAPAQVITAIQDIHAVIHALADIRGRIGQARAAPTEARRSAEMRMVWLHCAQVETRIAAITAPGLRRRVAALRRQLEAARREASAVARQAMGTARRGTVVDISAVLARRPVRCTAEQPQRR